MYINILAYTTMHSKISNFILFLTLTGKLLKSLRIQHYFVGVRRGEKEISTALQTDHLYPVSA